MQEGSQLMAPLSPSVTIVRLSSWGVGGRVGGDFNLNFSGRRCTKVTCGNLEYVYHGCVLVEYSVHMEESYKILQNKLTI